MRTFLDRDRDRGEPPCWATTPSFRGATSTIARRLDRLDANRPGFLALLRQALAILRRIDGLLEDHTRRRESSPRITVGA